MASGAVDEAQRWEKIVQIAARILSAAGSEGLRHDMFAVPGNVRSSLDKIGFRH